ncbi:MAG: alanine racemase [Actinomycetota bacterium]|nr:alanine racemase [Actinomycetota bacterium]
MVTRPLWAEVDLSAIKHNVREAMRVVGKQVAIMAVVKANAYGHGADRVAKAACEAGASVLGVAIPEEGANLRKAGITQPIHVLAESTQAAVPILFENDLTATICSITSAAALSQEAVKRGKAIKAHVKVDTGMNRIGLFPEMVASFIRDVRKMPGIELEGIFTHFAEADNPKSDYTNYQLRRFKAIVEELEKEGICPPVKHAANSAAVYLYPDSYFDMVRIGISMYGLHPSEATKEIANLKPAFSLKARLSFVKEIACGEGVSYSRTYKASCDTKIGTVPAGYGDGYTRLLSNKARVLVGGRSCPAVGNICMDQFMVDLGPASEAKADDEVVLIGRQGNEEITVDELAEILGTINYEILCMINARVPRVYNE